MSITIRILIMLILFTYSTIGFTTSKSYELEILDDKQNDSLNVVSSIKTTNLKKNKNVFFFDQDIIKQNIEQFNDIMYTGKDYITPIPLPENLDNKKRVGIYAIVIFASIVVGFAGVIPVSSSVGMVSVDEERLKVLLKKLLDKLFINFLTSKDFNANFIAETYGEDLKNFFSDPQNFFIRSNFFYLLLALTPLLSAITYNNIYLISNVIVAKKNDKPINEKPLASTIAKITINTIFVSVYIYGIVDTINASLQTINNINTNQPLDTENNLIKYLGTTLCGMCTFAISFYMSIPVTSLLVDTLALIPEVILRKKIYFNEISMPNILHYFLDTKTKLEPEKQFVLNLLQDKFKKENNYSMVNKLRLMNLNLSDSINLSSIVNNISTVSLKKSGYFFRKESANTKFIIGSVKLSAIAVSLFVLYKVANNVYTSLRVAEKLYENGYFFIVIEIINNQNIAQQLEDNQLIKNLTTKFDIELKKEIQSTLDKYGSYYLNLSTQLSIYAAAGILHVVLNTIDKTYSLIKHRGKLYRGPLVVVSAIMSSIIPAIACYAVTDYFLSDIKYLVGSEEIQQYVGFDTSVLGISSAETKVNILKTAFVFTILQWYQLFLPVTTPIVQKFNNLWNYFIKNKLF